MKKSIIIILALGFLTCEEKKTASTANLDEKKEVAEQKTERNLKPDGTPYSDKELENMGHTESMVLLYEVPTDTLETIGILVYDGFFTMDALGPLSVLNSMYPTKNF